MTKLTSQLTTMNGTYSLETDPAPQDAQRIKIIGIGSESLNDGLPVKVVMQVDPDTMVTVEAEGH